MSIDFDICPTCHGDSYVLNGDGEPDNCPTCDATGIVSKNP